MNTAVLSRLAQAEATAHRRYGRTGETAQFGPLVAVHAGPDLPLDSAWHDGTRPPTQQELEAFEAFSARSGQPATLQLLSAFVSPVLPLLKERGYALDYVLHAYVHDLTNRPAVPAADIREEEADAWAALAAQAFGPGTEEIMSLVAHAPGTRLFVAELSGTPAATAALQPDRGRRRLSRHSHISRVSCPGTPDRAAGPPSEVCRTGGSGPRQRLRHPRHRQRAQCGAGRIQAGGGTADLEPERMRLS